MNAPRHPEDRALNAVRRVRDAREQDSRFGLQHALDAARAREAEVEQVRARQAQVQPFTQGTAADFTARLTHLGQLADLEQQAVEEARDSRMVAEESTRRWQRDRQRVRVVDSLIERRVNERRAERLRVEARELDDLASQSWLRRRDEAAADTTGVTRLAVPVPARTRQHQEEEVRP